MTLFFSGLLLAILLPFQYVPWLHAVYAVLGAGVFTLVSLAGLLGPPSQLCDSLSSSPSTLCVFLTVCVEPFYSI